MLGTVQAAAAFASGSGHADGSGQCTACAPSGSCAEQAAALAGRCRRSAAALRAEGEPVRARLFEDLAATLAELPDHGK